MKGVFTMKYKRVCWWCKQEFETEDIDLDFCSNECFHRNEDYVSRETEESCEFDKYHDW